MEGTGTRLFGMKKSYERQAACLSQARRPRLTLALWGGVRARRVWALPTSDSGTLGPCVGVQSVGLTNV